MRILIDSCTFLWYVSEPERLSKEAATLLQDKDNAVFMSTVTSWEYSHKYLLKKLSLPVPPSEFIPTQRARHRIELLPVNEETIFLLEALPLHHRDPFDRLLIAQAIHHQLPILTPDAQMKKYDIDVLW